MNATHQRVALNIGGGYVPGLGSVIMGAVRAASELGWGIVGIRDGFDGLLFPERYPTAGLLSLDAANLEFSSNQVAEALGTNPRTDPFRVQTVNTDNQIEEVDQTEQLLANLREHRINAVISIVGRQALSVLYRLHRKGLKTVCIPKSVENEMAATQLCFGFNSALSFAVSLLESAGAAARSSRKIGVVEVPSDHAGWLPMQAAIAVCADAVLIPEIPYNLAPIAARLKAKADAGQPYGLVVVAEGAHSAAPADAGVEHPLKRSLSPLASNDHGAFVINRTGHTAQTVALELQRLTGHDTYPLALGQLIKGGPVTVTDRQLGMSYGAAAVRAIRDGRTGAMIAFDPPEVKYVPLAEAVNKIRTVLVDSLFVQTARSLGISLGE